MRKSLVSEFGRQGIIFLIQFYQYTFSTILGPCCRFTPSCSSYALQCIQLFGMKKAIWFILKRLAKCHPFHPGGYDPVPEIDKKY